MAGLTSGSVAPIQKPGGSMSRQLSGGNRSGHSVPRSALGAASPLIPRHGARRARRTLRLTSTKASAIPHSPIRPREHLLSRRPPAAAHDRGDFAAEIATVRTGLLGGASWIRTRVRFQGASKV